MVSNTVAVWSGAGRWEKQDRTVILHWFRPHTEKVQTVPLFVFQAKAGPVRSILTNIFNTHQNLDYSCMCKNNTRPSTA